MITLQFLLRGHQSITSTEIDRKTVTRFKIQMTIDNFRIKTILKYATENYQKLESLAAFEIKFFLRF